MSRITDPSASCFGSWRRAMSATNCPGMENSMSDRFSDIRRAAAHASGPISRKVISWRSPTNVRDCQSIERKLLRITFSRPTPDFATSARKRPDAADERASFIIALSPCNTGPDSRWRDGVPGRFSGRRQSVDRRPHRVRTVPVRCQSASGVFQLVAANAQEHSPICCDSAQTLFQPISYLSRKFPMDI